MMESDQMLMIGYLHEIVETLNQYKIYLNQVKETHAAALISRSKQ